MRRVVLVLPTGTYRAPDFVRAAADLGAEVVVASDREQVLAADRSVVVDLDDPDGTAAAVAGLDRRLPVDAVVAVDDAGVVVAAEAAAALGLPHNPPEAVAATRDKSKLRAALAAAEVPQPASALVQFGDDLPDLPLPWVVKPLGRSGSTGVIRVDRVADAPGVLERVRDIAGDERAPVLVETFVPGAEVAVEGLLRSGALEVLAVFDKPDASDGPYFEETVYVTPSRHPAAALEELQRLVQRACGALGLREGPVHAEARLGPRGPVLLEVAARSIGGLCSRTLRFGAGVSLEELILRHALGLPTEGLVRQDVAAGVLMLPIPRSGTLREVGGREEALAVEGVVGLEITVTPGRAVRALPEGDRYLGFLFARAPTTAQVEASLREGWNRLRVVID